MLDDDSVEKVISHLMGEEQSEMAGTVKMLYRRYTKAKAMNHAYLIAVSRPIEVNVYQDGKVEEVDGRK